MTHSYGIFEVFTELLTRLIRCRKADEVLRHCYFKPFVPQQRRFIPTTA